MSLLKQILSPFVEFEDDKKKEPIKENIPPVVPDYRAPIPTAVPDYGAPIEQNVEHPLITSANFKATPQTKTTAPRSVISTPLPEHLEYFEKLIDEANEKNPFFQGTDYKEFLESKFDIDNIADEATRYKTAFNVLKRTGLTKEKLLSTAHEYHNLVGRDLNAFQGAHSQQYQKEVKQREQLIQKKAEELQVLSQKMNALKKEISQLSQEITETKDRLDLTKNSFLLAGENKQNEIQTELQKIEQYF